LRKDRQPAWAHADGIAPAGWNDFGNPNAGASYVGTFTRPQSCEKRCSFGLHFASAFSRDDQNVAGTLAKGGITVLGADAA